MSVLTVHTDAKMYSAATTVSPRIRNQKDHKMIPTGTSCLSSSSKDTLERHDHDGDRVTWCSIRTTPLEG